MWPTVAIGPVKCGIIPDFVQVAERHDFEHLGNPADIRQGGSGKVDIALFDERSEIRAGPPFFSCRQGNRSHKAQLGELRAKLFLPQRIFRAKRPGRSDPITDLDRFGKIEALVKVDHPVAIRSDAFADLFRRFADFADA